MHEVIMRDDMFTVTENSLSSIPVFAATSQVPFGLPPALCGLHALSFFFFLFISVIVTAEIYTKLFIKIRRLVLLCTRYCAEYLGCNIK